MSHITRPRADSWRRREMRARNIHLGSLHLGSQLLSFDPREYAHKCTHTNARTHAHNSGLIRGWGLRRLTCQPPRLWASSSTSQNLVCLASTNRITGLVPIKKCSHSPLRANKSARAQHTVTARASLTCRLHRARLKT